MGRGKLTTDAHSVELKVGNNNKATSLTKKEETLQQMVWEMMCVCTCVCMCLCLCVYLYVSMCVYVRSSIPGFSTELGQILSMTLEHRRWRWVIIIITHFMGVDINQWTCTSLASHQGLKMKLEPGLVQEVHSSHRQNPASSVLH